MDLITRHKNKLLYALPTFCFLSAATIAAWLHAKKFSFVCDDAYISFRYAQNLARYGALEWNLGERVEGFTNFLWTVLLAGFMKMGISPVSASLFLGRLMGAAGVVLMFYLLFNLHRDDAHRKNPLHSLNPSLHLGPFLLASTAAYACWSSGGLETSMFTSLILGSFVLYMKEERCSKKYRFSGIVMAAAAMTRPEAVLLFAWMGVHRLVFSICELWRRSRKKGSPHLKKVFLQILLRDCLWAGGFVLIYGAYFLWRYNYYGHLFPNTYYIKASSPNPEETWMLGRQYLDTFVRDYRLIYLAWVPPIGIALSIRNAFKKAGSILPLFAWTYALGGCVVLGMVVVKVGGDFMAMHRFWVPVIPFLVFMLADTIRQVANLVEDHLPLPRFRTAAAWSVCGVFSALLVLGLVRISNNLGQKSLNTLTVTRTGYHGAYDGKESVAFMDRFARDRVLIGEWLKKRVPRNSWIAVGGAGAIVFSSELNAIDSFGLSDAYVAHKVEPISSKPGHQKLAPMSYILSREPDIICTPQVTRMVDWEYRPPIRVRQHWERHGYQYFCANPQGLRPSHYCCLMRADKDLGLTPVSAYLN